MSIRSRAVAGLGVAATIALLMAVDPSFGRFALTSVACLVLPGLGWARKMRLGDPGDTLALTLVLSVCATVAVGTAMAVAGTWSVGAGLAVLGMVALGGLVPGRAWAEQVAASLRRGPEPGGDDAWTSWRFDVQLRQRRAEREAQQASEVWGDWYADVERRAVEVRAREAAAARQATDQWVAWYQRTHLLTRRRLTHDDRSAGVDPHHTNEESRP